MNNKHRHIAIFLLLPMLLQLLPVSVWHNHIEEQGICLEAAHKHTVEEQGCRIAIVFGGRAIHGCKHQQHITSPEDGCETCSFHFVKTFLTQPAEPLQSSWVCLLEENAFEVSVPDNQSKIAVGRGPPIG